MTPALKPPLPTRPSRGYRDGVPPLWYCKHCRKAQPRNCFNPQDLSKHPKTHRCIACRSEYDKGRKSPKRLSTETVIDESYLDALESMHGYVDGHESRSFVGCMAEAIREYLTKRGA